MADQNTPQRLGGPLISIGNTRLLSFSGDLAAVTRLLLTAADAHNLAVQPFTTNRTVVLNNDDPVNGETYMVVNQTATPGVTVNIENTDGGISATLDPQQMGIFYYTDKTESYLTFAIWPVLP